MIRVAVAGALGRMGSLACEVVQRTPDLQFAGGFARQADPGRAFYADLGALLAEQAPEVVVDFTLHPASVDVARTCISAGVSPVIGVSGWSQAEREALQMLASQKGVGAMIVPNFAIGAVLMMRFAEEASKFFPSVEIVELHHDGKRDKPSGTARLTAERIAAATSRTQVPIHSVRLKGLVAHQEVLFGNTGELLTIRHDSLSRESFAAGIVFAIRAVREQPGLTVGLDRALEAQA